MPILRCHSFRGIELKFNTYRIFRLTLPRRPVTFMAETYLGEISRFRLRDVRFGVLKGRQLSSSSAQIEGFSTVSKQLHGSRFPRGISQYCRSGYGNLR